MEDKEVGESLNSLDLRNGGVALYLENFNRLNCTLAVLFSALEIDSSLLPSLVPSLKCLHFAVGA